LTLYLGTELILNQRFLKQPEVPIITETQIKDTHGLRRAVNTSM